MRCSIEAKNLAHSLEENSVDSYATNKEIEDELTNHELRFAWVVQPEKKKIDNFDLILISKNKFKVDFPSGVNPRTVYIGISSTFQVIEISQDSKSAVLSALPLFNQK